MILKHRDAEVLRFEWTGPRGVRVLSAPAANRALLPLEMKGATTDAALLAWLRRRAVPKNRHYVEALLARLGLAPGDLRGLVAVGKGLSLNDVYWAVPDGFAGRWRDFNLYENEFSKTLAAVAFTGLGGGSAGPVPESSPELTTNGVLAKCWRLRRGVVTLYKGGTEGAANLGFEPHSEWLAAQVAAAMGLPHVEYGLELFKGRLCSTCPLFTGERFGFLPAGAVLSREEAASDPRFADVFLFDAVVMNPDRHLGNFGFLVNNDRNEIAGVAPIFDNGLALFSRAVHRPGAAGDDFRDLARFARRLSPALLPRWLDIPGGLTDAMRDRLRPLLAFRFRRHRHYNLPPDRLRAVEAFVRTRAAAILEKGAAADIGPIRERTGTGTRKITFPGSLAGQIRANMAADPFITYAELADLLDVPQRTLARKIAQMRDAGEIRREGATKNGRWVVSETRTTGETE